MKSEPIGKTWVTFNNLLLARVYVNLPEGKWKICENLPGNMAIWYILYIYIYNIYIYRGNDWKMMINDLVVPIFRQPRFKLCLLSHGKSKKKSFKIRHCCNEETNAFAADVHPLLISSTFFKVGWGTLSVWWSTHCKTSLRRRAMEPTCMPRLDTRGLLSANQAWQWKSLYKWRFYWSNGSIIYKWRSFNCHVWLPEGNTSDLTRKNKSMHPVAWAT